MSEKHDETRTDILAWLAVAERRLDSGKRPAAWRVVWEAIQGIEDAEQAVRSSAQSSQENAKSTLDALELFGTPSVVWQEAAKLEQRVKRLKRAKEAANSVLALAAEVLGCTVQDLRPNSLMPTTDERAQMVLLSGSGRGEIRADLMDSLRSKGLVEHEHHELTATGVRILKGGS